MAGLRRPDFRIEGRDWPHREHSTFVRRGGFLWHVQAMGEGPPLLLLHGTGASTHSFRDLMPLLAARHRVIAPDLPGHAFTATPPLFEASLPAMARALVELLDELRVAPVAAVGHSAGAALLVRMALDGAIAPRLLVGLGAALEPFRGAVTALFSPAARLLARSEVAAQVIALQAGDRASVERMLRSTGSPLDARGVELYRRLAASPGHVAAVLAMLSRWDLEALHARLPTLEPPLLLLAGERDHAVPPGQQRRVAARARSGRLVVVPGAGHLLHEERPREVAALILGELAAIADR